MEEALLQLEKERSSCVTSDSIKSFNQRLEYNKDEVTNITNQLIQALHNLAQHLPNNETDDFNNDTSIPIFSSSPSAITNSKKSVNETAEWLYTISSTIPSPLDTFSLSCAILSACQLKDESQIQSSLFDTLGEGERAMEVLFDIVPRASEIRLNVTEQDLQTIANNNFNTIESQDNTEIGLGDWIDPEQERMRLLRQQVIETANYAALTKAQAEASRPSSNTNATITHTVSRISDKAAQKLAKKAAKDAATALAAAKAAGAIIDESTLLATGYDSNVLAHEAQYGNQSSSLNAMTTEQIKLMQAELLPEYSSQFYDQKTLPAGTIREFREGYEIVQIPAKVMDPSELHARLKLVDVMNATERKAFSGTNSLNPMQSVVFEAAFHTNQNLLICAPTGAGKTNVAMLTVVAHLREKGIIENVNDPYAAYQHIDGGGSSSSSNSLIGRKIIYIAPMKALAQEVVDKFSSKLKVLNIVVRELTGDMQLTRAEAERADIIVTTPEKWDVVTRKGGDGSLGQTCGLLIIDEVHLLADERGAVIESVVARLHRYVESSQRQVRIVGLSATLPNYKDVATFLRVDIQRGLFHFGPEHRPVPLQQQFIGVTDIKDRFRKEKKMNEICYETVIDSLERGYQVMVFVHSRKGTGDTARALADIATENDELSRYFITMGSDEYGDAHSKFADRVQKSRNKEVLEHFNRGMGIHHAGMLRSDRKLTEQMFAEGAIRVLCCTATLAWGINLPAHTVVVKGTEIYDPEKGCAVDLSILDVMQIFGRAGRPQYDTSGEATLITSHDALARYLDKLIREVPIESNFIKQLPDHLNAEVVGGTVSTIKEAAQWLEYTYLHVRMRRNPLAYGVNAKQLEADPFLDNRSTELVTEAAKTLDRYKMVVYHPDSGNLSVTDLGRVASHFYIRAESVCTFNELLEKMTVFDDAGLFNVICNASEFQNVKVRAEELGEVDQLVKENCPVEIKSPLEDFSGKSCVLMQSYISSARVNSFTLISDINYIATNAGRVARALFEMCLKRGNSVAALKLLRIAKSIDKRIWWFQTPLRQFEGEIKGHILASLENLGGKSMRSSDTFEIAISLLDMQPNEVGQLCHSFREGEKIQRYIRFLPRLDLQCRVQPVTKGILRFQLTINAIFEWNPKWHGSGEGFWLWVEDNENEEIYHQEYILLNKRSYQEPINLELTIPAFDPLPSQYYIRAVFDSWIGSEFVLPVSFKHLILPEQEMPYTDLFDLTPLPVGCLQNSAYEQLYSKIKTFNPIQTQLFHVLYHSDAPVLLGAPTGSGKTIVAEIALLRMKRMSPKGKCVYIAPLKSLARERLKEWKNRLGKSPLNWKVLELSGDTHHDGKSLKEADVLVCTPEKWDLISRSWRGSPNDSSHDEYSLSKGRDFVKDVKLLILDEIHLLGEERGAVLEAIVSRTRFISKMLNEGSLKQDEGNNKPKYENTRIIGLSTAIANPYDLADWIGIKVKGDDSSARIGLYNFRPSVRPVPLGVHISEFSGRHYCPRMASMNKPCYAAIKQHSPKKPVIVFVSSRRQTRLTALDLINYAASDENPRAFLGCDDEYIDAVSRSISDASLRHCVSYGVGLHHAGLSSNDREIVEKLFLDCYIQVLVATATLAWGVNLPAHLVIVKGTEYFDGKTSRYVDYPITDILQMIGRAGRPQFDTKGTACLMVQQGKKSFYKRFLYSPLPIESCLAPNIANNINAEIVIGTIASLDDCINYLNWTFFARRVELNPSYYGAKSNDPNDIDDFFHDVSRNCLDELKKYGCVEFEGNITKSNTNVAIVSTELGCMSSQFYLNCKTPQQLQVGIRGIRRMILENMEIDDNSISWPNAVVVNKCRTFDFPPEIEVMSVAAALFILSGTHEFDELPVRHNEEHLNLSLSENLPWGYDCRDTIKNFSQKSLFTNNETDLLEVMKDPHTKCFLLLQAFITHAALPISDYVNDTNSVIDQIPRLLAAMQYCAKADMSTSGSFDLLCLIIVARQIIHSRSLPGSNPLDNIPGLKERGEIHDWNKYGINSLRDLLILDESEISRILDNVSCDKYTLKYLQSIPLHSAENVVVRFDQEQSSIVVEFDLNVKCIFSKNGKRNESMKHSTNNQSEVSLNVSIGTAKSNFLLTHKSIIIPLSSNKNNMSVSKRHVEMIFKWKNYETTGGPTSRQLLLRIQSEQWRGIDVEYPIDILLSENY